MGDASATACAPALQADGEIGVKQIKDAAATGQNFTRYMTEVHRMDQLHRAAVVGVWMAQAAMER